MLIFFRNCYCFLNSILRFAVFVLFRRIRIPDNVRRILIFRPGNIGDIMCAIPAMIAIREKFQQAEIVLLSSPGEAGMPGAEEILREADFLNDSIVYYQNDIDSIKNVFNLFQKIRVRKFDLFIELPRNMARMRTLLRDIIFAKSIGVKYAFGFEVNTIRLFRRFQSKYMHFDTEVQRLLKVVARDGIQTDKAKFLLAISENDKETVQDFLRSLPEKNLVALNPNGKRQTNIWPLERFAQTAKWLIQHSNVMVLIIGGAGDKERTKALEAMIPQNAIDVAGRFSILETIELLKHCMFLISNDTGPVHMAAAVDTAVVDISSARDFKNKWSPYGTRNIVLRKEPRCHTCLREQCEDRRCLKDIPVGEVIEAATRVIENGNLHELSQSKKLPFA